ncbi:hypothetical protein AA103196_2341 [Ameyamaea chiangmaiensis NBRC 103196]|uniref:Divergent polysaccharide deacetylase family protein n=1 Tax=Ameyamaea chiangmaiensis TaxID=442969 RepID=A0A850P9S5_9PROT|nr:divergent polysaccharide deacetylase family protein [Ameyamaea chiangmaiensis]MBS4075400.1 divergent polysaccharide deacetylase family protein [Ameyamaea chiangmaiensis]NVN41345.1 divergent polysaccharide deacetylase family protein [Ameyamaea chiangmaiensis]GBQ69884.1 hypothetical protein AA103196_2341 [Ameyamaea chiangmaiensis NBRC 103196]
MPAIPENASRRSTIPPVGRALIGFWGGLGLLCVGALSVASVLALRSPHAPPVSHPATRQPSTAVPRETLIEPLPDDPTHTLPIMGRDGAMAARRYAAASPVVVPGRPQIAILVDGFGLDGTLSQTALERLPAPISVAMSPYLPDPEATVRSVRAHGHEIFLSLPMEPANTATNDEGPNALGYDHSASVNQDNLHWSLSRFGEYVGVTNAAGGLDGDGYARSPDFNATLREIRQRGLLYLNVSTPPGADSAPILRLTNDLGADTIDAALDRLEHMAKDQGRAILVTGALSPVLLDRLLNWASRLSPDRGVIVPVSALSAPTTGSGQTPDSAPLRETTVP